MNLDNALNILEESGRIKFRWLPGMQAFYSGAGQNYRCALTHEGTRIFRIGDEGGAAWDWPDCNSEWTYDLDDPLTVAGLFLLVREAYNAPRALIRNSSKRGFYHIFDIDQCDVQSGNWKAFLSNDFETELEAIEDALIALAKEIDNA